jgi:hypothetical protein
MSKFGESGYRKYAPISRSAGRGVITAAHRHGGLTPRSALQPRDDDEECILGSHAPRTDRGYCLGPRAHGDSPRGRIPGSGSALEPVIIDTPGVARAHEFAGESTISRTRAEHDRSRGGPRVLPACFSGNADFCGRRTTAHFASAAAFDRGPGGTREGQGPAPRPAAARSDYPGRAAGCSDTGTAGSTAAACAGAASATGYPV